MACSCPVGKGESILYLLAAAPLCSLSFSLSFLSCPCPSCPCHSCSCLCALPLPIISSFTLFYFSLIPLAVIRLPLPPSLSAMTISVKRSNPKRATITYDFLRSITQVQVFFFGFFFSLSRCFLKTSYDDYIPCFIVRKKMTLWVYLKSISLLGEASASNLLARRVT